jgi:membrane protein DedA with SNARE-associated domain
MSTIGAVLGGYITYAIAREGGREALERKFDKNKAEKVLKRFQRWSFWSVTVSAVLPPPFPIVPVLLAAGGSQYPRLKFLAALSLGRAVRYLLVAGLGALYGDAIVSFFSRYYLHAVLALVGIAVIGGILTLRQYLRSRRKDGSGRPRAIAPSKVA